MNLASLVKSQRQALGLTARQVAAQTGISFQYLADIEHGAREPHNDALLHHLAESLHLPSDVLYFAVGIWPPDLRAMEVPDTILITALASFRALLTAWDPAEQQQEEPT